MPKAEESDLLILLKSLSKPQLNEIIDNIKYSKLTDKSVYIQMIKQLRKTQEFNKTILCQRFQISSQQLSRIKHKLFRLIIDYKISATKFNKYDIKFELLEFEVLKNAGLYTKAIRKLEKIKKITEKSCEYEYFLIAQRKALQDSLFLFQAKNGKESLQLAYRDFEDIQKKFENLIAYRALSDEVLLLHYEFLDKRIENRSEILNFLNHPLLKNIDQALSVLAKYCFYRIYSLIHLGDNNYEKSRQFSLQAFTYINQNKNNARDDYMYHLNSINNYLDACIHLGDAKSFENMYPQLQRLVQSDDAKLHFPREAISQQLLISCRLNFLWLTRDSAGFLNEFEYFKSVYDEYEGILKPNIQAELLLGFSKLFFIVEQYDLAEFYCSLLFINQKNNPTHLVLCAANILRIMINYELGNIKSIPFTINSSKYFIKSRKRYFGVEQLFLTGIKRIKPYQSKKEVCETFINIKLSIENHMKMDSDTILDSTIGLIDWLDVKCGSISK